MMLRKNSNIFLKLRPEAPEGDRVKALLSEWEEKGLIKGAEKN